jgi:hypothetical protein
VIRVPDPKGGFAQAFIDANDVVIGSGDGLAAERLKRSDFGELSEQIATIRQPMCAD